MKALFSAAGRLAGLVGIVLMLVAGIARLAGYYHLAGLATGTIMLAGIGAVTAGCFLLLWHMLEQRGGH